MYESNQRWKRYRRFRIHDMALKSFPTNSHASPVILRPYLIEADCNIRFFHESRAHVSISDNEIADDPVKRSSSIFVYLSENIPVIDLSALLKDTSRFFGIRNGQISRPNTRGMT